MREELLGEKGNKGEVTFIIPALDPAGPCACPLICLSVLPSQTPSCLCCKHKAVMMFLLHLLLHVSTI